MMDYGDDDLSNEFMLKKISEVVLQNATKYIGKYINYKDGDSDAFLGSYPNVSSQKTRKQCIATYDADICGV